MSPVDRSDRGPWEGRTSILVPMPSYETPGGDETTSTSRESWERCSALLRRSCALLCLLLGWLMRRALRSLHGAARRLLGA